MYLLSKNRIIVYKYHSGARIHRRVLKYLTMEYRDRSVIKVVFSLCCLQMMVSWTVFGQDSKPLEIPYHSDEEGDIDELKLNVNKALIDELNTIDLNRVTLQQMGQQNEADIIQLSGDINSNLAIVHQKGFQNQSKLLQEGTKNATDILQSGERNYYSGYHSGNHLINRVIQRGDDNFIEQRLLDNNMNFQLSQYGNNNEILQLHDESVIGYTVTQRGNNMQITIFQNQIE